MPRREPGDIRIGISGWRYAPWRGIFYPRGLQRANELRYAASRFRTIEINGTFYGLQRPEAFAGWATHTPDDFVFAVKAPRYITHMLRLRDAVGPLANFLASGPLRLGAKLGPILWQLPPDFAFDPERIEAFLHLLPHNTSQAAGLARQHDVRFNGRVWVCIDADRPLRHALEVRHDSFCIPAFIDRLRAHRVALVCADALGWPRLMDLTADFVYCRLHGSEELYASGYDDAALDTWAGRVVAWARGENPPDVACVGNPATRRPREVFVYFDNDAKVRAPADATGLIERVTKLISISHARR